MDIQKKFNRRRWIYFEWDHKQDFGYGEWWKKIDPSAAIIELAAEYTIAFGPNCVIYVLRNADGLYLSTVKIKEYVPEGYMAVRKID